MGITLHKVLDCNDATRLFLIRKPQKTGAMGTIRDGCTKMKEKRTFFEVYVRSVDIKVEFYYDRHAKMIRRHRFIIPIPNP